MAQSKKLADWSRDAGLRRSYASLGALAEVVGAPKRSVIDWLTGTRSPYLVNAARLASVLGVSVDAVARACALAAERERARVAARKALRDALKAK